MQFNPKLGFVLGILVTIEIAVSSGTLSLTHAVPAAWIPTVTAWSAIMAFIGSTLLTFLHGYSSGDIGPLVAPPPPDMNALQRQAAQGVLAQPPRLPIVILLAVGFVLLLGMSANAQTPRRPPTGNPIIDIGNAIKAEQQQSAAGRNESTQDLPAKPGK